jgi:hypothetical protein
MLSKGNSARNDMIHCDWGCALTGDFALAIVFRVHPNSGEVDGRNLGERSCSGVEERD